MNLAAASPSWSRQGIVNQRYAIPASALIALLIGIVLLGGREMMLAIPVLASLILSIIIFPLTGFLFLSSLRIVSDQFVSYDLLDSTSVSVNTHLLLAFAILAGFLLLLATKHRRFLDPTLSILVALFTSLGSVACLISDSIAEDLPHMLRVLPWLMILLAASALTRSPEHFHRWEWTALATLVVPVAIGLYELRNPNSHEGYIGVETLVQGFGTGVHTFALPIIFLIGPVMMLTLDRRFLVRLLAVLLAGTASIVMFFTFVRNAWLAFVILVVVFGLLSKSPRLRWFALSLLVCYGLFLFMEATSVEARFRDFGLVERMGWDRAGSGRVGIWTDAFSAFVEAPLGHKLFGLGSTALYRSTGGFAGHSDLVDGLLRFGVLGLIAYMLILWRVVQILWKHRNSPHVRPVHLRLAWATLGAFAASALTNGIMFQVTAMIYASWTLGGVVGMALHQTGETRIVH